MEGTEILGILFFFGIAGIMYSIYIWKTVRARRLFAKAKGSAGLGNPGERLRVLKDALWKANEDPHLENSILNEIIDIYRARNISFDSQDYKVLVSQYEQLSKKGSSKAFDEIIKVQTLKKKLIDRMPIIS
jgi:hypothetical protein